MKRTIFVSTVALLVMAAPLLAQRGGGSSHGSPAPKPQVSKPQVGKTSPPKAQSPKTTMKPASAGPKTPPRGASSTKTSSMKPAKSTSATKTTVKSSTAAAPGTASSKTKTSSKTTTTVSTTLTPVQQKLQRNTNLASKLQSRLPAGTNLQSAAAGFRNLGQFVAAVNVSNNLGIPFSALKTRMIDQGMSLGQAIQDARPSTTDTTVVARRAESDADDLIRTTEPKETTETKRPKVTKKAGGPQ
jgi:hypothetical protein